MFNVTETCTDGVVHEQYIEVFNLKQYLTITANCSDIKIQRKIISNTVETVCQGLTAVASEQRSESPDFTIFSMWPLPILVLSITSSLL